MEHSEQHRDAAGDVGLDVARAAWAAWEEEMEARAARAVGEEEEVEARAVRAVGEEEADGNWGASG